MAIIPKTDTANRADGSIPTKQMQIFLAQSGINPTKYSAMNSEAERTKVILDERLATFRREKLAGR